MKLNGSFPLKIAALLEKDLSICLTRSHDFVKESVRDP